MQACAKRGGFSLPNFKWYYWVMNVKQLRAWLPTAAVKPIWSQRRKLMAVFLLERSCLTPATNLPIL